MSVPRTMQFSARVQRPRASLRNESRLRSSCLRKRHPRIVRSRFPDFQIRSDLVTAVPRYDLCGSPFTAEPLLHEIVSLLYRASQYGPRTGGSGSMVAAMRSQSRFSILGLFMVSATEYHPHRASATSRPASRPCSRGDTSVRWRPTGRSSWRRLPGS